MSDDAGPATDPAPEKEDTPAAAGLKARLRALITRGKTMWGRVSRRPGVAHLLRAYERSSDRMASQFAAAITYFSFLSLVPILMVSFAIGGFILSFRPQLLDSLKGEILSLIPSHDLAEKIGGQIDTAVNQALAIGIVGLLVAAYSGLNWMSHMRKAVRAQWRPQWERDDDAQPNIFIAYAWDLVALFGLLLAGVASFALTAFGTAAQNAVLGWLGLESIGALAWLWHVVPIAIAVVADVLIFGWMYTILPRKENRADRRTLLIGAVVMSVVFEILKAALTILVSRTSSSPTGAVFGSIIGLLLFFNLVARAFLMIAAWIATGAETDDDARVATGS